MYHINKPEVKPMRWNKLHVHLIWITQDIELHCAISAFVFRANRSAGAWGSSFCFVPFRFNTFARFVSGFPTSRNLSTRTGDRFSFSVARDQMLFAWGDRAPLEHSLGSAFSSRHFMSQNIKAWKFRHALLQKEEPRRAKPCQTSSSYIL